MCGLFAIDSDQQFLRHVALSKSTTGRHPAYNTIGQSVPQLDFHCHEGPEGAQSLAASCLWVVESGLMLANIPERSDTKSQADVAPLLLDAKSVAMLLSSSRSMLYQISNTGELGPMFIKLGTRSLWRYDELAAWVRAGCPRRELWVKMAQDQGVGQGGKAAPTKSIATSPLTGSSGRSCLKKSED